MAHVANIHIHLAARNFGVQEWSGTEPPISFSNGPKGPREALLDAFPASPEFRNGDVYANDKPGLGVDINETGSGEVSRPRRPSPLGRRRGWSMALADTLIYEDSSFRRRPESRKSNELASLGDESSEFF